MVFKKVNSILYVEDEKLVQEQLADVIQDYCNTLYLADNGEQGLLLYQKYKPEIVISDVKMPIMDGIEMVKQIKAIDDGVRVVFSTAFSDYEFLQSAIEMQVDGYVLKPISLEKFENKLHRLVQDIKNKEDLESKEKMLIQQSKVASMGEMLSNIAHQWRQPLSAMAATISSIKLDVSLGRDLTPQTITACADSVEDQVAYLSKIIDDFRKFFRPNDNEIPYKMSEFISRCKDLIQASFSNSKTIDVIIEMDNDIENIEYYDQLIQAILNILNNARDALKKVEETQNRLMFLFSIKNNEDNEIVITIKDNAGGIPENIIERIFDPYFTTKHKALGTGLGLYITHTIITSNLKGSIGVENEIFEYRGEEYKGAKFVIKLPIKISNSTS